MSDFVSHRQIKATRRPHRCHGCLAMIPTGSSAEKQAGHRSSGFWQIYFCSTCRDWLIAHPDFWEAYQDGCMPGDVAECWAAEAARREARP